MREISLWRKSLGVEKTVIEGVRFDEAAQGFVVRVRPYLSEQGRCGICGIPGQGYDRGGKKRRWRALDCGDTRVWLEGAAPRVACAEHGVVVAQVPWARHGAGHTRRFDQRVAWLTMEMPKSAITELMRISWDTVGTILARVWAETGALVDRLDGLRRIAIDEVSYKKGREYLIVVSDHDTGRPVWLGQGRDTETVQAFFDELGHEGRNLITHVSADGAGFIRTTVRRNLPDAVLCADPFHVISWANEALDEVRRAVWNQLRREPHGSLTITNTAGRSWLSATGLAREFKRIRHALRKGPENLSCGQRAAMEWLVEADPDLHRAYLLKEGLRAIFQLPYDLAGLALDLWITDAKNSGLRPLIQLATRIEKSHVPQIMASIKHHLTNSLAESINSGIRHIIRAAYGYRNITALKAMIMFKLAGPRPQLRPALTHT